MHIKRVHDSSAHHHGPNAIGPVLRERLVCFGQLSHQGGSAARGWWLGSTFERVGHGCCLISLIGHFVGFDLFHSAWDSRTRSKQYTLVEHGFKGCVAGGAFGVDLNFLLGPFFVFEFRFRE